MPIYEYRCEACDRHFDQLRPMEFADSSAPCPSCGKPSSKQLSVFAAFSKEAGGQTSAISGASAGGCGAGCCGGSCASLN